MFQKHNGKRSTAALRCSCMLGIVCGSLAHAEEAADAGGQFYGLLRGRDLTPFGSLRLDMRPAHAVAIERGSFAIETEIGYQNTWALSPEVERYLIEQDKRTVATSSGRRMHRRFAICRARTIFLTSSRPSSM
jgi:hypothetical protein